DSDALAKLIVETIKDRSADGPYLIISQNKEYALIEKLGPHFSFLILSPNELAQFHGKKFRSVLILTPLSLIKNLKGFLQELRGLIEQNGNLFFLQPMV